MIRDYCPVPMRARTRVHMQRCGFALERRRHARIPDRDYNGEPAEGDFLFLIVPSRDGVLQPRRSSPP